MKCMISICIILISFILYGCEVEKTKSTQPSKSQIKVGISDEYQIDFFEDHISAAEFAFITGLEGYIFIRSGSIFINDVERKIGEIIPVSDTLRFAIGNKGATLFRWNIAPLGRSNASLQPGFGSKLPSKVVQKAVPFQLESKRFPSQKIGTIEDLVIEGSVLLRAERLSLQASVIVNTIKRSGPAMSALVIGNIKIQRPHKDELMTELGEVWYEAANSSANYITYESTEIITVSLLPPNRKDQLTEMVGLISNSTGEKKGDQYLLIDKIIEIKN